ncbi:MAG: hypothetical protein EZS28_011385 [Streblomastix strix]|uniref:Uncharacterized protein n=1 Tax=Streblomastix strix TaxID=222440 RepID=A0A5J4WFF8_9EUKA|nr:MAG: hypothetical protein EZS28_011385 [Streblomastix strix]
MLGQLQTHIDCTKSSYTVELPFAQLDLDVFQSDRQLTPTVTINVLIQHTTPLPLIQGQLVQILEGITQASLQETEFNAANMQNTQVLEIIQLAARAPQHLQQTEIPAADRQHRRPLSTIDSLASETLIDTVSELVLALRQVERANMAKIKLFSGINFHFFDGNNNSMMSHANLATTQRQIGIQQLTSEQCVLNVQENLVGTTAFQNYQSPKRRAMPTTSQITNNLLLGINTKSEQQTQQSQILQTPSQGPFQAQLQQNLQLQQQPLSLNRDLLNIAIQLQLNQPNPVLLELSLNRQQQITSIPLIIQNPQQQGCDTDSIQTHRQITMAKNSHIVMKIDMESEGLDINPPQLEAKIKQASFNRLRDYWAMKSYFQNRGETISIADWRKFWKEQDADLKLDTVRLQSSVSDSKEQGKEKDLSTAFWNKPRKRYRQDYKSNSDRKVVEKEKKKEISEEEITEEIEAVKTEIIGQQTPFIQWQQPQFVQRRSMTSNLTISGNFIKYSCSRPYSKTNWWSNFSIGENS